MPIRGKTKRQKQDEAIQRQEARNNRSAIEQLRLLDNRPGESKRERNKLLSLVA
jgi:hypothetical protein